MKYVISKEMGEPWLRPCNSPSKEFGRINFQIRYNGYKEVEEVHFHLSAINNHNVTRPEIVNIIRCNLC